MSTIDFTKNDTYRRAYNNILQIKKHANSKEELPTLGASNGDIYSVGEDNELYIFNSGWKPFGGGGGNEGVYGLRLSYMATSVLAAIETREQEQGYCWTGNFGDLADAVDAGKAGTLKDIYLGKSYHYSYPNGGEGYGSGRTNVNDYYFNYYSNEVRGNCWMAVFSSDDALVRRLTFDEKFTTDSMRFMGDVYESLTENERLELVPCVIGGSSPFAPLVFSTRAITSDGCSASCVMATVINEATPSISRLIPTSGYFYSFQIDSLIQLYGDDDDDVDYYYGTVRAVVEEPDPGTLPGNARGYFVLNEDLAKSLIGKRVIVRREPNITR